MDTLQIETLNSITSAITSVVALIVSIIALIYTVKTYLLKSGAYIRGSYSICSSISCEDKYVHHVKLENLKDRAVVIFKIYLKVGHNYFLEIEDFENDPLILRPFEIFNKEYEPVDLYSIGMGRILLNDLLDDRSVKRQIVLSTSEGKYIVKDFINYWDPIFLLFQNHATAVIRPMRSIYKGKSYGSNAKFVVEFKMENGSEEIVPIYPRDYEVRKFKHFSLTKDSLESKENLEDYLYEKVIEGSLKCADVLVYDLDSWRNEIYEDEKSRVIKAEYLNWFQYNVVAKIESKISDYRLQKQNRSLKPKKGLTKRAPDAGDSAASQAVSKPKKNPAPKQNPRPPQRR
jgi:hypothetical protein